MEVGAMELNAPAGVPGLEGAGVEVGLGVNACMDVGMYK